MDHFLKCTQNLYFLSVYLCLSVCTSACPFYCQSSVFFVCLFVFLPVYWYVSFSSVCLPVLFSLIKYCNYLYVSLSVCDGLFFVLNWLVITILIYHLPSVGPPKVTLNPVPQTSLKKNAQVVLTCNASSPLQMKIAWFKNEKPIEQYGSQLKIDNFQYEDQGDYYCSFSTYLTSSKSKPALLVLGGWFSDKVTLFSPSSPFKLILCFSRECYVTPRQVMSCHVISRHVTSRRAISCHVKSACHVVSYHVQSS